MACSYKVATTNIMNIYIMKWKVGKASKVTISTRNEDLQHKNMAWWPITTWKLRELRAKWKPNINQKDKMNMKSKRTRNNMKTKASRTTQRFED